MAPSTGISKYAVELHETAVFVGPSQLNIGDFIWFHLILEDKIGILHIFRVQNPGLSNLIQLSQLPAYRQMEWEKLSSGSEFFLLGSLSSRATRGPLWAVPVHVPDHNGRQPLIILAISADAQLHTPMYFSLANLSLTDVWFVTTTVPKMLANTWIQNQIFSCAGCLSQLFLCCLWC